MAFLIVEDDPVLADVLRVAVTKIGDRPVVAGTLGEADLVLETVEVNGIVVDLELRGGGALDWIEAIHLLHPPFAHRTIALVDPDAGAEMRSRIQACEVGALHRPFTGAEFMDAVRERLAYADARRGEPSAPSARPAPLPDTKPFDT